jgi:DNA polymerase-1
MTGLFNELPDQRRPPRSALRASAWTAPLEPPNLAGVTRLGFDTEARDERLEDYGPGTFSDPNCYAVGLSLATDDGRSWYLPTRHEGGGNCTWDVRGWARSTLNSFKGELVGANVAYDLEKLAMPEWGVTFPKVQAIHDVQVAEPLIDEWQFSYSLEAIAQRWGVPGKAMGRLEEIARANRWKTDADIKKNLWRMPASDVGEYAEGDADRPLRILPLQLKRLEADEQLAIYDLERRLVPVLIAMRQRGVRVDIERARLARSRLIEVRDKFVAEVKRIAGPRAELMEADSLAPALEARGIPLPRTPKSKRASISKVVFERYRGDALIDALAGGRRVNTLITTFFDGHIFGHLVDEGGGYGRVHCEFNGLKREKVEGDGGGTRGTIARLSSNDPNMQNIPARKSDFDEDLDLGAPVLEFVRGCFVPEEDEDWDRGDYSQVEYRFLVNKAVGPGGAEARRAYNEDPTTDFHKQTATMMNTDPEDAVKRKRVKITNFSYVNGAGTKKLAATMNCSEDEAVRFMLEYNTRLSFVRDTYKRAMKAADRHGVIKTVLGRKQRFPFWEPANNRGEARLPPLPFEEAASAYGGEYMIKRAHTYKAINRYISGSAADLMKKSMVDAYEAGICDVLGPYLLTVHDELDTSVPRTPAGNEAVRELVRIMETCITCEVPFLVESTRGKDWGEAS